MFVHIVRIYEQFVSTMQHIHFYALQKQTDLQTKSTKFTQLFSVLWMSKNALMHLKQTFRNHT